MNRTLQRMSILRKHIEKWVHLEGMNQISVTIAFTEKFKSMGFCELLADREIHFFFTKDPARDAERNRVKLFRQVGIYNDGEGAQPERVFEYEPAIVAAMPESLRFGYLNETYWGCEVNIGPHVAGGEVNPMAVLDTLIRESAEAKGAYLDYLRSDSPITRQRFVKEAREILSAWGSVIDQVDGGDQTGLKLASTRHRG